MFCSKTCHQQLMMTRLISRMITFRVSLSESFFEYIICIADQIQRNKVHNCPIRCNVGERK